jgi:hypothetical protein
VEASAVCGILLSMTEPPKHHWSAAIVVPPGRWIHTAVLDAVPDAHADRTSHQPQGRSDRGDRTSVRVAVISAAGTVLSALITAVAVVVVALWT